MTTLGNYTRGTIAILALSIATISATGPTHVIGLQTPVERAPNLFGFDPPWVVSTGGLLFCVWVLVRLLLSEKKERKDERAAVEDERKRHREEMAAVTARLEIVLSTVATAGHAQALATQRNTDAVTSSLLTNTKATERLAGEVRILADRRREDRE